MDIFRTNSECSGLASLKELPIIVLWCSTFCPKRRKQKGCIEELCQAHACVLDVAKEASPSGKVTAGLWGSVFPLHGHKVGESPWLEVVTESLVSLGQSRFALWVWWFIPTAGASSGSPSVGLVMRHSSAWAQLGLAPPSDVWPSGSAAKKKNKLFPGFQKGPLQECEVQMVSN